jgi:hypothetical protein
MNKLTLDLILEIYSYLLTGPILITDFIWVNGRIKVIDDKKFKEHIITNNIKLLNMKYKTQNLNTNNLVFAINKDIQEYNMLWKKTKHTIYVKEIIIKKLWKYNEQEFILDDQQNYKNFAYKIMKAILHQHHNIQKIENLLLYIYLQIKIGNVMFHARNLQMYFDEYLEEIDNELSNFKVTELIEYINTDLNILSHILDE